MLFKQVIEDYFLRSFKLRSYFLIVIYRFNEGIEAYNKALEIKPDDAETLTNKGNAYAGLKQFQEAIQCYDRVLGNTQSFYLAYQNKGLAKIELGLNEIGIACLNKALALNPNLPASYNNKVFFVIFY